jgi:predicted small secreted protein
MGERFQMRKHLAIAFTGLIVLFGAASFLSACNTIEGAGKDVTAAGREVTEEAKEHK